MGTNLSTSLRIIYNTDRGWPEPIRYRFPITHNGIMKGHCSHRMLYLSFYFPYPGVVVVLDEPVDGLFEGLFEWSEFEVADEAQ